VIIDFLQGKGEYHRRRW